MILSALLFFIKEDCCCFWFWFSLRERAKKTPYFIEPRMLLMWEALLSYVLFRKKEDVVNYGQILADFSDGC